MEPEFKSLHFVLKANTSDFWHAAGNNYMKSYKSEQTVCACTCVCVCVCVFERERSRVNVLLFPFGIKILNQFIRL